MRFCFRVDSSHIMGSGHIVRCMTLADKLRKMNHESFFICRELNGNLINLVEHNGFTVFRLPKSNVELDESTPKHASWLGETWQNDAVQTVEVLKNTLRVDWLVVDHYSLETRWEEYVRPYVDKILVIDDLADRKHDSDLLLDQNLYDNPTERYSNLVPLKTDVIVGPRYALLRDEFIDLRKRGIRERSGKINRILVFFGGSDPTNETQKALNALEQLQITDIMVDVVVGIANRNRDSIERYCSKKNNINYYCQVNNMATLMENADLFIGAGGSTTWERCCLGLPSMVVSIADNQQGIINNVARKGALIALGTFVEVSVKDYCDRFMQLLDDPLQLVKMGQRGMELVDGLGTERVVAKLSGYTE